MPQGFKKNKLQIPSSSSKDKVKKIKKPLSLKKGHHDIAPKKARHVEEAKLKKTLTKVIHNKVEKELMMLANNVAPSPVVSKPKSQVPSTSAKSKVKSSLSSNDVGGESELNT